MPLSKQIFNITSDVHGTFSSQYPIFLANTGITINEYTKTVDQCSSILQTFRKKVKFLIGVYFMINIVVLCVLVALLLVLIGIPLIFIVPFIPLLFMYLHFSKLEREVKKQLFEFLEQENNQKYISRGVQFMLIIKPPSNGRGFDTYDIQVTLMSGYSQSNLQSPMIMIINQSQSQKLYQSEETELSSFESKGISSLAMESYNPKGYL